MDRFPQARRSSDPAVVSTRGPVQVTRGTVRRRPQVNVSAQRLAFRPARPEKPLNSRLVGVSYSRDLYLEANWLGGEGDSIRLLCDDQVVLINLLGLCNQISLVPDKTALCVRTNRIGGPRTEVRGL